MSLVLLVMTLLRRVPAGARPLVLLPPLGGRLDGEGEARGGGGEGDVHGVHVEAGGGAGPRVAGEHARHAAAAGAGAGVVVGGAVQPGVGGGLVLS